MSHFQIKLRFGLTTPVVEWKTETKGRKIIMVWKFL